MSKHFTDAELAAEYWFAMFDLTMWVEKTYPHYDEQSYFWPKVVTAEEQKDILERFATLPSAV